jgi:demethylmacrocin O-methyltransferase
MFAPFREHATSVLEIGVDQGASLRMWRNYFVRATVYGLDIDPLVKIHETPRTRIFIGDQGDPQVLGEVGAAGPFDIIIEDGSHIPDHQIRTFISLFPHLKPGGLYVCEDIQTQFWGYGNRGL